ncbi:MAG: hypothetical protein WCX46_04755 [Candidatus Paceibacterota bacterium]
MVGICVDVDVEASFIIDDPVAIGGVEIAVGTEVFLFKGLLDLMIEKSNDSSVFLFLDSIVEITVKSKFGLNSFKRALFSITF